MGEPLRVLLAIVMLAAGVGMVGYAGYLQYASLPEEHTMRKGSIRVALALGGVALLVGGSQLLG